MNQPLVSMITYCYNGERFVHKYFEAILSQTYRNIELIFFNNGSKDRTGEIAENYREKLEARGVKTQIIHYEENQNTCELKQKGFELMHGDYFFGCDSDDLIHPTYIEEMAGFLQAHPEKGVVFCQLRVVQEETGEILGINKTVPSSQPRGAYLDMLNARNCMFTAISYMMSRAQYERINPGMKFFISRFGENYQILLPFLYHDLQGYIEKPLGDYTVRGDSYSEKMKRDPQKQINAYKGQEISILATLDSLGGSELDADRLLVKRRLRRERFYAAVASGDTEIRRECFAELRQAGGASAREYLVNLLPGVYRAIKKR
ncbi:MAG: glycosyltransferase family 2 protein [Oscillospiraceae bacterium]|nr:glycosyltransferase family 2 protein [Oscillospiraceae bacterium]